MIARKYTIPKDFDVCKDKEGNDIFKSILEIAISKLLAYIPTAAIKDIQLTGSIAKGEGTVIKTEPRVTVSDIDMRARLS